LTTSWGQSRWGRRAAAVYILLIAAAAGYVTYHALFNRARFGFPGVLLLSLGLPWTRAMDGAGWPLLLAAFALNAGMLYFVGVSLERLSHSSNSSSSSSSSGEY
jgi:hypothetical protein